MRVNHRFDEVADYHGLDVLSVEGMVHDWCERRYRGNTKQLHLSLGPVIELNTASSNTIKISKYQNITVFLVGSNFVFRYLLIHMLATGNKEYRLGLVL
jgi:hypothetical protein